jgi:hypothetical protein
MGKKRKPKQVPSDSQDFGCGQPGSPIDPANVSAAGKDEPAGVPIGLPVSDKQYEEMQRHALHPDPHQAKGQEDSSA